MLTETVYKGSDNVISFLFKERKYNVTTEQWEEAPINFVTDVQATKMELYTGTTKIAESPGEVKYFDAGVVELHLGASNSTTLNKEVVVSIKVFSALLPNGKTILHPKQPKSSAKIFTVQS
jgi:hypothetical protein